MNLIIKDMTIDDFGTLDYDDNNYLIGTGRVDEVEELAPVRHGKWVDYHRMGIDGTFHWFRQCSECLYEREDDNEDRDTPYCPDCGAKMDLEEKTFNTTPYTEFVVNLYTETKLRFVLDEYIEDEELIEKILKALDGDENE